VNAAESKYRKARREFPATGSGVHPHIMRCVNYAVEAGLDLDRVEDEIHQAMPRPPSPINEVRTALTKAAAEKGLKWAGGSTHKKEDPEKVRQAAIQAVTDLAGAPMPVEALSEISPMPVAGCPTLWGSLLLHTLFASDDILYCGGPNVRADGLAKRDEWIRGMMNRSTVPPLFCANPLSGELAATKTGSLSYRCDAAVARHLHAIYECDIVPLEVQASFLAGRIAAGWPIVSVVYSGGKSLHALIKVECADAQAWELDIRGTLFPKLVSLGADAACANPSRMTRMPGSVRPETGNMQTLLWLARRPA